MSISVGYQIDGAEDAVSLCMCTVIKAQRLAGHRTNSCEKRSRPIPECQMETCTQSNAFVGRCFESEELGLIFHTVLGHVK